MAKKDHLSNELGLNVSFTETGVSGKAKMRSLAALDRLFGSLMDIPAAKLEAVANRVRAESDREVKFIASESEITQELLENDRELARAVAEHSLQKQMQLAANKVCVGKQALEYLAEHDTDADANEESASEKAALDDDWLNQFERYAEQASSDRMRDLWARVLAGEIRKPNSFSLVTLRFLSELDKDIAELFQNEAKYWLKGGFILMPRKDEMRDEKLFGLTFLEEVGLLQDVTLGIEQTWAPNDDGIVHRREGQYLLVIGTEKPIKLPLIRLTRVGREITRILPMRDHMQVLERIEKRVHSDIHYSEIAWIVNEYEGGKVSYRRVKTLKEKTE